MTNGIGEVTLHVCVTCRRGDEPLEPKEQRSGAKMRLALATELERGATANNIAVEPVECLSGCKRGCTVAFTGEGKWTYVVAGLDPASDAPELLTFAAQYAAHPEGIPVWRERPEIVKRGVLARVPPQRKRGQTA